MYRRNHPAEWMWSEAMDLVHRAERLHRQFFRPARAVATWEPPVDVFEDAAGLTIVVALPGVDAGEVEVVAEPGSIVVRAERALALAAGTVRQLEIPYGYFERRIALPPGVFELHARELGLGCLTLRLSRVGQGQRTP